MKTLQSHQGALCRQHEHRSSRHLELLQLQITTATVCLSVYLPIRSCVPLVLMTLYYCCPLVAVSFQFFISALSFSTFAVSPELPQNRLQLSFTLLLTSVTFKFVINQSLPKISYLTYMVSLRVRLHQPSASTYSQRCDIALIEIKWKQIGSVYIKR